MESTPTDSPPTEPARTASAVPDDAVFRELADQIPTLCWIADSDGYIVWYNRRWHAYCGTTPAQMEGWGWQSVHDPAQLPTVMARWVASIASGEPFEMTFPLRGADGVFRPFLTRIQPIRDATGAVLRWFGVNTDVSEQVAAEAALRVERDRARSVLENMDEGFVLLDAGFRVVDINALGLRMEQRAAGEIVGKTHWEAWPGSKESALGALYRQAMAERTRVGALHRYAWGDGRVSWIDMRAFPTGDGLAVFYRDVSERHQAEERLAQSEARFRAVAETMPGFVWTADAQGLLDYTSPHWHAYSGTDPDASHGSGWAAYVHPDDQAATFARWGEAVAASTPYEVEFRLRRADGLYRWWLARARPSTGGEVGRWVGVCTDIDDIVAARKTLAHAREQLASLVEERTEERDRLWRLVPDLLMTGSLGGQMLSVNEAWTVALGYDEATLIGRPFWGLIHPDDRAGTEDAVRRLADGRPVRHQNRLLTATGQDRWFDWLATPVGDLFYAVARDITDDKRRAAELEVAQDALRQSQKMEAVGRLTGGIAHDYNNMLAVVIGSLELLNRRAGAVEPGARRHVQAALDAARRSAALTQRLLGFSRQQPLSPETLNVNTLVGHMSDLLRHSIGAQVRLETVLAGGLWVVRVDPNQLENVILNLGVNARDAMPSGGRLTIETQNGHLDARYAAAHPDVAEGQYVAIAVTDTGAGMPPEVVARAFEPFFTTKDIGKGTGLGLSQVYGFIKQSGGHVKIYSELGHGTTVKIYLPRVADHAEAVVDGAPHAAIARGSPDEVVLVVEDEPSVRQLSAEALTELGYTVLEADSTAAALALLDAHPEISLLFTDIVMPEGNGVALADEARRRCTGVRVLFTTGYTPNAVIHNGTIGAVNDMIGKPFTLDELAAKVRKVLDAPLPHRSG